MKALVTSILFIVLLGITNTSLAFSEKDWYNASEQDLLNYIVKGPNVNINLGDRNQILDFNHIFSQYMQDWANTFDKIIRQSNPAAYSNIPPPRIAVPNLPRQFSNTTTMPLCVNMRTQISSNTPIKENANAKVYLDYYGKVDIYDRPCKLINPADAQFAKLMTRYNNIYSNCKIAKTSAGLTLSSCPNKIPFTHVGGFVFNTMSNWILMDFSKFTMEFTLTEDMLLSELSHELGHYYESHLSNSIDNSFIYYHLENRIWNAVPKLDNTLQQTWKNLPIATENYMKSISNNRATNPAEVASLNAAANEKIGAFTLEDQAFYLQSYYLSLLGINPHNGITYLFNIWNSQKHRQSYFYPNELNYDKCLATYLQGQQSFPSDVFIPVANFSSLHHTPCFYLFEIYRGIEANSVDYRTRTRPISKFNWEQVKTAAKGIFVQ